MNHSNPVISIALCTYNGENYLRQQLDSLIAQSYTNLEIVIIDDCSSDNTFNILKAYKKEYKNKNIHIFQNKDNIGFNQNFEKCLTKCSGEYICICDQDDIWQIDKVKKLYHVLKNSGGNSLMAYSDSEFIDPKGNSLNITISQKSGIEFEIIDSPLKLIFANWVSGHAMLFSKDLLKYGLPIPNGIFYDWWLAFIAASIAEVVVIDEVLVKHRQHDQSVINKISNKKKSNSKKKIKKEKYQELIKNINIFKKILHLKNKDKDTINYLCYLEEQRQKQFFSFKLFFLFVKNRDHFFLRHKKKSMVSD